MELFSPVSPGTLIILFLFLSLLYRRKIPIVNRLPLTSPPKNVPTMVGILLGAVLLGVLLEVLPDALTVLGFTPLGVEGVEGEVPLPPPTMRVPYIPLVQ